MKLVRFGAPGKEKPGIIDSEGRIRDLSGVVPDIAGDALSPKSLAKLRSSSPTSCRRCGASRGSGRAWARSATSSP